MDAPVALKHPPALKLIYLDHHYWRAECVRLACHIAGVPLQDARMSYEEMYSSGALTFGTFPALVVEGHGVLNQTQAIARYVGGLCGLYPGDPFASAKADEALDGLTDVSDLVTATMQERNPERKIAWRRALIAPEGRMSMLLTGLEGLLAQNSKHAPHCAGESLSVSDLALWRAVDWLSSGVIDGIPPTYISSAFPRLWRLHLTVDALPEVAEWKKAHPRHYRRR